jgi:hypothetical protein
MEMALILFDLVLLAGVTARFSRFFTSDFLGDWWIVQPVQKWAASRDLRRGSPIDGDGYGRTERYVAKLFDCPFCIGQWIAFATVASLFAVGGPGDAAEWWRWVAGAFTLNYVIGHLSARLDG